MNATIRSVAHHSVATSSSRGGILSSLGRFGSAALIGSALFAMSCQQSDSPDKTAPTEEAKVDKKGETTTVTAPAKPAKVATAKVSVAKAVVGQPAPNFSLLDIDGKEVSLSQFRGATVVLEWFNPDCPFVKAAHGPGSLKGLAAKNSKDTVWLAINSGGKGKQGNSADANRKGMEGFGMKHPLLLDESGAVGKLYGAERTPHMYVINPKGILVYKGAIDNSPDGEGKSPTGGKLINYIDGALTSIREGKPVTPAETKAYGCGVKYGDS